MQLLKASSHGTGSDFYGSGGAAVAEMRRRLLCPTAPAAWGHLPPAGGMWVPYCSHRTAAAPTTYRTRTSCSAYSRTAWRTAILCEVNKSANEDSGSSRPASVADGAGAVGGGERRGNGGAGPDSGGSGARLGPPPDGVGPSGGAGGGTLADSELRVKLSLAAGSGRLDLTDCRLQRLPAEVLHLTELEELQLSGNCLTQLPDAISRLTALRRLGLAGNLLTSLPPGIGALTALEGLWLHGNLLTCLPQQLGKLGGLRTLSLAGNRLESVPAGALSGLTSLTDLTLAGNRLAALPPGELAPLTRLGKLALNGNLLTMPATGQLGLGSHMTSLTELMMQGNQLEGVDRAIFECPALQELSLADNRLRELPPQLSAASRLSRLHLFGNCLTCLSAQQLAGLPALTSCWLEGNPLGGEAVVELLEVARSGSMPQLKALGLDSSQVAAAQAAARQRGSSREATGGSCGDSGSSDVALPPNVRVGCVLGSGPGYFKLQYGPQRATSSAGGSAGDGSEAAGTDSPGDGVSSRNELLVVAFGSAPGTPNWGGLLSKVYRAAAGDEGRYFDVLYVADPYRDWYGGGDDSMYGYYRGRFSSYARHYRRVLLLGDSMGATAALMFADLATAALAFCPQVDLTAASIRPGRPDAWLTRMRERLVSSVRRSRGELSVLVGTWQHDLAQANLLPALRSNKPQHSASSAEMEEGSDGADARGFWDGRGALGAWREADVRTGGEGMERAVTSRKPSSRVPLRPAVQRKPWAWEQEAGGGWGNESHGDMAGPAAVADMAQGQGGCGSSASRSDDGGVCLKVFSVDSHRLAAALDARGQLVPLVRDAILHQLGLPSGNVRVANLL